jgi:predicted DCC family thiol-disulfide oxidoreductase YuxK
MEIIYFDGDCNLCGRFVDFLLERDHKQILRFSPLQGQTAMARLPSSYRERLGTVVFECDGKFYVRSTAAIKIVGMLGGVYALVNLFRLIPRPLRDAAYRIIAKKRYLWFGRRNNLSAWPPERTQQLLP